MFFLISILSAFFYAINGTLLSHFSRRIDPLFVSTLRGIFLIFWMLPLLFFVDSNEWKMLPEILLPIFLVGFLGSIGFFLFLSAVQFLPIGIAASISSSTRVFLVFLGGAIFLGDQIHFWQIVGAILILVAGGFLSMEKFDFAHLKKAKFLGVSLAIFAASFAAIWWIFGTKVSREISPFLFAYFGEVGVGIGGIILFAIKNFFCFLYSPKKRKQLLQISKIDFWKIFFTASTTLIGTGGFFLAAKLGSLGVASAIGASGIFFSTLLGKIFFNEKLKTTSWIKIMIIVIGIFILFFQKNT